MGFFTGAYLKIMTGKMKRQLQNRLVQVTMQMNRVTKQIGDMEKQLQNQENMMKNYAKQNMSNSIFSYMQNGVDLSACKSEADKQAKLQEFQYAYQQRQAYAQAEFNYQNDLLTAQFDMYREANLEPLKNTEDSLATEKATLETRIQTLSDQEKAAQEMEKQGAKDMAPDYTGQGQ